MLRLLLITTILCSLVYQGNCLECIKCRHSAAEPNEACLRAEGVPTVQCDGECFQLAATGDDGSEVFERGCLISGYGSLYAPYCLNNPNGVKSFVTCHEDLCNKYMSDVFWAACFTFGTKVIEYIYLAWKHKQKCGCKNKPAEQPKCGTCPDDAPIPKGVPLITCPQGSASNCTISRMSTRFTDGKTAGMGIQQEEKKYCCIPCPCGTGSSSSKVTASTRPLVLVAFWFITNRFMMFI